LSAITAYSEDCREKENRSPIDVTPSRGVRGGCSRAPSVDGALEVNLKCGAKLKSEGIG
jgi:hypothetical protein